VLAVLSVFSSLSAALIQNLSKDDLTNLFGGVKQVSADLVQSAFDSLISMIPDIPIPKSFDPVAYGEFTDRADIICDFST